MTAAEVFDVGDVVRITGRFSDFDGVAVDPSTVKLRVCNPRGEASEKTGAAVVRDAAGSYHADVTADVPGVWSWGWVSTGTGAAAEYGSFTVRAAPF